MDRDDGLVLLSDLPGTRGEDMEGIFCSVAVWRWAVVGDAVTVELVDSLATCR